MKNLACFNIFCKLKETFIIISIFIKFNLDEQIIIDYNTFDYIIRKVFSQFNSTNTLRPVLYFSKNILLQNITKKFMIKN